MPRRHALGSPWLGPIAHRVGVPVGYSPARPAFQVTASRSTSSRTLRVAVIAAAFALLVAAVA
ncbi:hypothetical protein ACIQJX_07960 [Streptomyces griseoviridis]|uniref:hypothetical protein n=1 Tax=Streptomyces griseoviridis TaxID=45398 RepID=UPI0033F6F69D